MSSCIVFVSNQKYLPKFSRTLKMLRDNGKYQGDIVLIIGNDLKEKAPELEKHFNVIVKYFPDIVFTEYFNKINININSDGRHKSKKFQWHKLHLFNTFFKKWNYMFYIDCGIHIFRPIQPIIDSKVENTLLARNDSWGPFLNKWSLGTQFDNEHPIFSELNEKYDLLNIKRYFQTGVMLYDTSIINDNTFNDLVDLAVKYPISKTNEQAIIALYFICIDKKWLELQVEDDEQHFYDLKPRRNLREGGKPYIMHKWWES